MCPHWSDCMHFRRLRGMIYWMRKCARYPYRDGTVGAQSHWPMSQNYIDMRLRIPHRATGIVACNTSHGIRGGRWAKCAIVFVPGPWIWHWVWDGNDLHSQSIFHQPDRYAICQCHRRDTASALVRQRMVVYSMVYRMGTYAVDVISKPPRERYPYRAMVCTMRICRGGRVRV